MSVGCYKRTDCRYCGSRDLDMFLSLGQHPPSDAFLTGEQIPFEKRYPLEVYVCRACWLVQLLDVVHPEEMFRDYAYLASSSKPLKNHYAGLAQTITGRLGLRAGDVAVDIGCNDGVLLSGYTQPGIKTVGVDPSNAAEVAIADGFKVIRGFFNEDAAKTIAHDYGRAKVVTATNVFPHVDDIASFTAALSSLLADDGVFVVEASYLLDLIDQTLFDTVYHEHLCYLSLTPMAPFLARFGLEVFDVERVNFGASGPAIRVWAQRRGGGRAVTPGVRRMLDEELAWGVKKPEKYRAYARQVEQVKRDLLAMLRSVKAAGHHVGGYGAPAKGSTLLNYIGANETLVEYIAENNPRKIGKLTPGSHIPIVSDNEFLRRMPAYALLLTWNYLDFFLKNSPFIEQGGRFIVPLPTPRIVPAV